MKKTTYHSPIGDIIIEASEHGICRVDFAVTTHTPFTNNTCPAIQQTTKWLDIYFSGKAPDFIPPLDMECSTFRQKVYEELMKIKHGETITYGELAKKISPRMSAQAIGGAMKNNHIVLIIPCHRVIGANGKMTGYSAGLWRKEWLLNFEISKNV